MALVIVAVLVLGTPIAAWLWWVRKTPAYTRHLPLIAPTLFTGCAAAIAAVAIERALQKYVDIDPFAKSADGGAALLIYTFAFAAPLHMALVALAVAPYWRLSRLRRAGGWSQRPAERDGMAFAIAAALGFAVVRHAFHVWRQHAWLDLLRVGLATIGFPLLASLWGYALGRDPDRGWRGRRFGAVWLGAAVFLAVQDELTFHRGARALVAAAPLVACSVGIAWVLWRDPPPLSETSSSGRLSMLLSAPAPSIGAIRAAFKKQDRPLTVGWISFGALVNTGVIVSGFMAAVMIGRKLGVDFSLVEKSEATTRAVAPVLLLGLGALAGFPTAGYLLARASGTRSVLEPALSSALAMLFLLVFLGLLAPTSLVFVMALTPVAFGLSCAGAWFGLAR